MFGILNDSPESESDDNELDDVALDEGDGVVLILCFFSFGLSFLLREHRFFVKF